MLLPTAIFALAQQCAPSVDAQTMSTLITSESGGNPYAIGVVGMHLDQQPSSLNEAVEVAKSLIEKGANISVGLGQINQGNWSRYGLTLESAFDQCGNVSVSSQILSDCYSRASSEMGEGQEALKAAFSCYYSNNFTRGFVIESNSQPSYVKKIAINNEKLKNVPEIQFKANEIKEVQPNQQTNTKPAKVISALESETGTPAEGAEKTDDKLLSWDVLNDFKN